MSSEYVSIQMTKDVPPQCPCSEWVILHYSSVLHVFVFLYYLTGSSFSIFFFVLPHFTFLLGSTWAQKRLTLKIWSIFIYCSFLLCFFTSGLHSFVVIAQSSSSSAHHCPSPYIFVTLLHLLLLAQFHIVFPSSSSLLLLLSSFPPPLLSFSSVSLCACFPRSFLSLYKWWRCVFIESDRVKSCIKVTMASSMTLLYYLSHSHCLVDTQRHTYFIPGHFTAPRDS